MSDREYDIELIESYLQGELKGEDLHSFEQEMKQDPDLANEVALHKSTLSALNLVGFETAKGKLSSAMEKVDNSGGPTSYSPPKGGLGLTGKILIGVGIVVSGVLAVYLLQEKEEEQKPRAILTLMEYHDPLVKKEARRKKAHLDKAPEDFGVSSEVETIEVDSTELDAGINFIAETERAYLSQVAGKNNVFVVDSSQKNKVDTLTLNVPGMVGESNVEVPLEAIDEEGKLKEFEFNAPLVKYEVVLGDNKDSTERSKKTDNGVEWSIRGKSTFKVKYIPSFDGNEYYSYNKECLTVYGKMLLAEFSKPSLEVWEYHNGEKVSVVMLFDDKFYNIFETDEKTPLEEVVNEH